MRRIATALLALAASMASVAHAAPPPMQNRGVGGPETLRRHVVRNRQLPHGVPARLRGRHHGRIHAASGRQRGREQPLPQQGRRGRFRVRHGHRGRRQQQRQAGSHVPAPFKGDYWIIGLDPEYRWAVVGTPDRKYLWILSRSPQLPQEDLDRALAAAKAQGYQLDELRYTPQK